MTGFVHTRQVGSQRARRRATAAPAAAVLVSDGPVHAIRRLTCIVLDNCFFFLGKEDLNRASVK